MRKNAPFDISDGLPEAISEKSSMNKVTAELPSDTYLDTFRKSTITVEQNGYPYIYPGPGARV
jgi:hypothetical protein